MSFYHVLSQTFGFSKLSSHISSVLSFIPTWYANPPSVCVFPQALWWWRVHQAASWVVFRVFLAALAALGKAPRVHPKALATEPPIILWLSSRGRWTS